MRSTLVFLLAAVLTLAACSPGGQPVPEATTDDGGQGPGWFGGYVDVTLTPGYLLRHRPAVQGTAVLSFVSSDPHRPCEPSWGGTYGLDLANEKLELDAQVESFRKAGGSIGVSFGGQRGTELAVACPDVDSLTGAYAAVIDRYRPDVVDLDIEGAGASDAAAAERRAAAVARLQAARPAGEPLRVWLTLPVSRDGLTPAAELSVQTMLGAGVDVAGVNVMTMNFGPLPAGQSMRDASVQAAEATHRALAALFAKNGLPTGNSAVWYRIGLTPMIGVNDVEGNVLSLADAEALEAFAAERGLGRMSMWSLNRDVACEAPQDGATHSCSGVQQEPGMFAEVLGRSFTGLP